MTTQLIFGRRQAAWLLGLLVMGLMLAACGSATESASSEAAASPSAEPAADTPTTAPPTEEAATAESETTDTESPSDSSPSVDTGQTMCHTATPQSDPIVGALQPNPTIAQVTDDEWSKGPANAPVTLIEYGDFQ